MTTRSDLKRFLVWTAISIVVVVVIAAIALFALRAHYASEREAAIAAIRANGEPLVREDISSTPRGSGEEPTQWLEEIGELVYGEPSSAELSECATELAALGAEGLRRDYWKSFALAEPDPPSPCRAAMLRRDLEARGELLRRALEVGRYSSVDSTAELRSVEPFKSLGPGANVRAAFAVANVLGRSAIDSAVRGESEICVERLRLAAHSTELFARAPSLIAFFARCAAISSTLHQLHAAALLLPRDVDLSPLDRWASLLDPRAELRRVLITERALGNSIFEQLRSSTSEEIPVFGDAPVSDALAKLRLDHDQSEYLRCMQIGIDAAKSWDFSFVERIAPPSSSEAVTCLILPRLNEPGPVADFLSATRDLVRATLIARRDGVEAARAWIAAQPDPCGTAGYFVRVETDGVLTMWSVGANGIDDGGVTGHTADPAKPLDIVARVRTP